MRPLQQVLRQVLEDRGVQLVSNLLSVTFGGDDGLTIKCSIKLNINTGSISGKITSFTFEVDGFSVSASGSMAR